MPGEWPTDKWLSCQIDIAHTFTYATQGSGSVQDSNIYKNQLAYSEPEKSMTREEQVQFETAVECQTMLKLYELRGPEEAARSGASWSVLASLESIEKRQKVLNEELATMWDRKQDYLWVISDEVIAPSWLFFHGAYTNLDTAILIKRTLDTVEAGNRKFRILDPQRANEQITTIRKLCDELPAIIHAAALKICQEFSSNIHHKRMVYSIVGQPSVTQEDDPIAYWLRRHFDRGEDGAEKAAQAYVTKLCRAWCEALRNLCKLTSPP
ncbi:MAG: hypothetical protein Q9178_006404 [Gyalolechia marmorata]